MQEAAAAGINLNADSASDSSATTKSANAAIGKGTNLDATA